jgi:putative transposase
VLGLAFSRYGSGAMPREKRIDEAGTIYHALNRGNARQTISHKHEDYEAFIRVLADGLEK